MEITAFEVKVLTEQANEHPKVFTKANIEYIVVGHDISERAVVRAIELSATRYCPAQGMLAKVFPIRLTYKIFEEKSGDEPVLITSGEWLESQQG